MSEAYSLLRRRIEVACEGWPCEEVLAELSTMLSQVLAEMSQAPEQSDPWIDALADALKKDIRKNWHLVEARRKKKGVI